MHRCYTSIIEIDLLAAPPKLNLYRTSTDSPNRATAVS